MKKTPNKVCVKTLKLEMRHLIRNTLKNIQVSTMEERSNIVFNKVTQQDFYRKATGISIFLSMPSPKEIQTWNFVKQCFKDGKNVFVPKVTGSTNDDMIMIPVKQVEDIESWPLSKWKIKEPPIEYYTNLINEESLVNIDLIIVPGLAFSKEKYRLGQGKGYYDTFFKKIYQARSQKELKPPVLIGVGLDEQIVDNVPVEDHDYVLDHIITPELIV